jgi:hypothetical protein
MTQEEKLNRNKKAGFGLIIGAALRASIEFISGRFTGIISATGAGLGLCIGALFGHYENKQNNTFSKKHNK